MLIFLLRLLTWPLVVLLRYRLIRRALKHRTDPKRYSQEERAGFILKIASKILVLRFIKVEISNFDSKLLRKSILFLLPAEGKNDLLLPILLARKLVYGFEDEQEFRLASFIYESRQTRSPFYRSMFNFTDSKILKDYKTKRESRQAISEIKQQILSKKRFSIVSTRIKAKDLLDVIGLARDSLSSIVLLEITKRGGGFFSLKRSRISLRIVREFDREYHIRNKIDSLIRIIRQEDSFFKGGRE